MAGVLIIFFFNDTSTPVIYTLSLHDALPISLRLPEGAARLLGEDLFDRGEIRRRRGEVKRTSPRSRDRKSTRLNSSHRTISYAVFCLKKKKNITLTIIFTQKHYALDHNRIRL